MNYPRKNKTNLKDVTFVIPLRVDTEERIENLNTLLSLLCRDFDTNIIILEADKQRIFYCHMEFGFYIKYLFIPDNNPVFHRTKYLNTLLQMANTKIVGVWDTDAICPPSQILKAVEVLRKTDTTLVYPYDGRFYGLDMSLSNFFKQCLNYELLYKIENSLPLLYGYHSVGGAFLLNKDMYIKAGGENEKIYGCGHEDLERCKRIENQNLIVQRINGSLFHLWHPIRNNSRPIDIKNKINNLREFVTACQNKK